MLPSVLWSESSWLASFIEIFSREREGQLSGWDRLGREKVRLISWFGAPISAGRISTPPLSAGDGGREAPMSFFSGDGRATTLKSLHSQSCSRFVSQPLSPQSPTGKHEACPMMPPEVRGHASPWPSVLKAGGESRGPSPCSQVKMWRTRPPSPESREFPRPTPSAATRGTKTIKPLSLRYLVRAGSSCLSFCSARDRPGLPRLNLWIWSTDISTELGNGMLTIHGIFIILHSSSPTPSPCTGWARP